MDVWWCPACSAIAESVNSSKGTQTRAFLSFARGEKEQTSTLEMLLDSPDMPMPLVKYFNAAYFSKRPCE